MDEKILEEELESFDFSQCHPVREELLNKLLAMQKEKTPPQPPSSPKRTSS